MTLKEKFEECLWAFDKSIIKNQSEKCDAIADEFAIGFASYLDNILGNRLLFKEIKELLEIYKKEKGL
jgi:hypothetical protein